MRFWHAIGRRLRSFVWRTRSERDLHEELQLHLERETERRIAQGMDPEAARLLARREFGAIEALKEECRDARGTAGLDAAVRDLRVGARRLARDWRFTVAAVLILGLGIGATTAIFSVVNAALFRGSPVSDPERLVEIYQNAWDGSAGMNSYPAYRDMVEYTDVFAEVMAARMPGPVDIHDGDAVRTAVVEYATANYLSVLGLQPSLGRWFSAAEDAPGAAIAAVVGHQSWTTRYGADPSIVGRTVRIEGTPVTIVGVGPERHNGTLNIGLVVDFWLPIAAIPAIDGTPRALQRRPVESAFFVKARLREDVTVARARAAMDILGERLAREYPDEDPGRGITVVASSDVRVHPQVDLALVALASVFLTVVGLVLAIACSNLATLLLVRGAARAKEISVRLALGASRGHLVRHLLAESLLLSAAGGLVGCVLAWWGVGAIRSIGLPFIVDFALDARVLAFSIVIAVASGVAFGLAPALAATKPDVLPNLRDDGAVRSPERGWLTLKNALIVFQVTVSVVLLASAGVFLDMLRAAREQPTGFAVEGVAMLATDARFGGYSAAEAARAYEALRDRVAAIPGVQSVALAGGEPMVTTGLPVIVEGADAEAFVVASSIWAGPDYFETLQIPVLAGRALDVRDRPDAPRVAVISESLARQHFGGLDAVGRRFRIDQDPNWIEVAGVVRDTKTANLGDDLVDPQPYLFYRASAQWNRPSNIVVARTTLDAAALVGEMQRELRALDPALPVLAAKTMAWHLQESLVAAATVSSALGVLGTLGLGLAGMGLYAVVAFAVSRRAREIGIRIALGAARTQVAWAVVRGVIVLLAAGAALGLALSSGVVLAFRGFFAPAAGFAYSPGIDLWALAAIGAFLTAVGLLAAFVPARRAATMDPLSALRHD